MYVCMYVYNHARVVMAWASASLQEVEVEGEGVVCLLETQGIGMLVESPTRSYETMFGFEDGGEDDTVLIFI